MKEDAMANEIDPVKIALHLSPLLPIRAIELRTHEPRLAGSPVFVCGSVQAAGPAN
jgi:hypothetical protein